MAALLARQPSTSFISIRVNNSTFLIIEDDAYGEEPYIYVKLYPKHILITDTGCNSSRQKHLSMASLRQYLEIYPLSINSGKCLNPGGQKRYIIICSHCHYDHILGIPQFLEADPTIIASDFEKSFILQELPKHSLCKFINVPTPQYEVSQWARHMEYLSLGGHAFRIQFLHIPGHTPDSLAWYDIDEHHLYVGDTFYERKRAVPIPGLPDDAGQVPGLPATQAAIIFPEEGGNWIQYMSSLDTLNSFVLYQNAELRRQHGSSHDPIPRVKVGCGHLTYDADAEDMIHEVRNLFERIIAGKVSVTSSGEKRGVIHDFWLENEDSRYSVMAPRHVFVEARRHFYPKASSN
ncbi:beta-lactamase-like protein [Rhexocercosporidium sp. MPI-PUGE-AT-0058]|nr:beta-lactamase-like protein [Rhexocercosporidium sp. MPI-PUGE-AT-0058]